MFDKKKNVPLTDEEENRKNLRDRRLLWLLIGADALLVIYLVFQMIQAITVK